MADSFDAAKAFNTLVVFVEHYPLSKPETDLFSRLRLKEIPVLSALDEPIFMMFGGERTIELMKKLGMDEHESVAHSMITSSIKNAQRKLEEKVPFEKKASSMQEWFEVNFPQKL